MYLESDEEILEILPSHSTYIQVNTKEDDHPRGHLVLATKSLTFCPEDFTLPVYRILTKDISNIKKAAAKGFSKKCSTVTISTARVCLIDSKDHSKMKVCFQLFSE